MDARSGTLTPSRYHPAFESRRVALKLVLMLDPVPKPESETQEIPDKLYFRIGDVAGSPESSLTCCDSGKLNSPRLARKNQAPGIACTGAKTSSWFSKSNACFMRSASP